MRLTRSALVPVTPAAVADARALVSDAEAAARAPVTLISLAWFVLDSANGHRPRQRRRCPTLPNGAA